MENDSATKIPHDLVAATSCSDFVLTNVEHGGVGVITLNRPGRRNALSGTLIRGLVKSFQEFDENDAIRVILLTSSPGCPFSAGADLTELSNVSTADAHNIKYLQNLSSGISRVKKPIVAAVEGYALGGGFEVALMCDVIYAAENARLGLPEVKIGTIPGVGGTQRLTRLVGKHLAMKLILTGSALSATEMSAYLPGLHIATTEQLRPAALKCAKDIARLPGPVTVTAKQSILAAERALDDGFAEERELYYSTFDLSDKAEGIKAFLEKRDPEWSHQ